MGSHRFSWTARDGLDTVAEPLTGLVADYGYDAAGRVSEVVYVNAGGVRVASRVLGYDAAGRVSSDVVRQGSAGAVSVSMGWGYNVDGSVATETVSVAGNAASGVWSYTNDRAGRLTGWGRAGQPAVSYTYDRAGNRTSVRTGTTTVAYTYDARNRLVGSPQGTHVWDAAGRLDRITNGASVVADYGFDGLGRLTSLTQGGASVGYTYDGLDRVAARNGTAFAYAGTGWDPVGDGTQRGSS